MILFVDFEFRSVRIKADSEKNEIPVRAYLVIDGVYSVAPFSQFKKVFQNLSDRTVVTSNALMTGKVLRGLGLCPRIIEFQDLVRYAKGSAAGYSLERLAQQHGWYIRETSTLQTRIQFMSILAETYVAQIPSEELELIAHTHNLFLAPILEVDTIRLENAREDFLRRYDRLQQVASRHTARSPLWCGHEIPNWKAQTSATIKRFDALRALAQFNSGKIPVYLKYCSTISGRFAGGDWFNIQGLPRPQEGQHSIFNNADRSIRSSIRAAEGSHLLSVDANAMEPRIIAWLGNVLWMNRAFDFGKDIYLEFIASMLQDLDPVLYEKLESKDIRDLFRQMAKIMFLSIQYGAGAFRIYQTMQDKLGKDTMFLRFGDICQQRLFCRRAVQWTQQHCLSGVEALKSDLFHAFAKVTEHGNFLKVGRFEFHPTYDSGVRVVLPSGRGLVYPEVETKKNAMLTTPIIQDDGNVKEQSFLVQQFEYVSQGEKKVLYANKLFENIVQGIGRDILAAMILYAERNGVRVACHIHDEIIAVVPDEELPSKRAIWTDTKDILPDWAAGMTLALNTKIGRNFNQI